MKDLNDIDYEALVRAANELDNPMSLLPDIFLNFRKQELDVAVSSMRRFDVSKQDLDSCFSLVESNMRPVYDKTVGWNANKKRREMSEEEAYYLLAHDSSSGRLVAFVHFRFDMDYDLPVLYCYEIQLIEEVRRKGLGKFLLQILYLLASHTTMMKLVCTVHKVNHGSEMFFRRSGFTNDESSPENDPDEPPRDYWILSKVIGTKKNAKSLASCCA